MIYWEKKLDWVSMIVYGGPVVAEVEVVQWLMRIWFYCTLNEDEISTVILFPNSYYYVVNRLVFDYDQRFDLNLDSLIKIRL
jgi:hypothetical protein